MRFDEVPIQMIEDARSGNPASVERLFHAIQDDMYAFLYHLLRDSDDASDALQECLVRVFRGLGSLQDSTRFAPWIIRLLVNFCTTHKARAGKVLPIAPDAFDTMNQPDFAGRGTAPAGPVTTAIAREDATQLRQAINLLSDRQRQAILLFELDELSLRETAAAMAITEGAVKFHLHEARKQLKRILTESENVPGERAPS